MLTIGLIDSYVIMRLGLTILINESLDKVEVLDSNTIADFSELHPRKKPDMIIMGNNAATAQDCLHAAITLKSQFPDIPLIVYDEQLTQNLTVKYFEIGINGYLMKESIAAEMLNCIHAVLDHKQFLCPMLLERLLKILVKKDINVKNPTTLTPREFEIAHYLSEGMKTSWIAQRLDRKPSTISTIKNNIFKKMKVENVVQLKRLFPVNLT